MFRTFINRFTPVLLCISVVIAWMLSSCGTGAFFYYPTKGETTTPASKGYIFAPVFVKSLNGNLLKGWFIQPEKSKTVKGTVLHFHGNAANISNQYEMVLPLVNDGWQAVVFDYQGYGSSEGKAKQEHVVQDGFAMVDYTSQMELVKGKPLVLFGQSLGGHLAIVVAAQRQGMIDALVVEGGFTGHEEIATVVAKKAFKPTPKGLVKLLVPSKYDAMDWVDMITIPKLFVYSVEDDIIPYEMGEALYEKAVAPKAFWKVEHPHIQAMHYYTDDFVYAFDHIIKPQ